MTTPTKAMTDETRRLTTRKAENLIDDEGVFLGHEGLRGLAASNEFWEKQDYGTRLYYGDGTFDYLHRSVLQAAIAALDKAALRSEGREDAAPVCPECYGTGRTDNHVTGEVECFHCEGTGTIYTMMDETEIGQAPGSSGRPCPACAAPDEARQCVSVPRDVLVKVDDALQRALDDRAPRRIPVDAADADILQVEIRKLLTAAPPAPNRDAWIPVSEMLPTHIHSVLMWVVDDHSMVRDEPYVEIGVYLESKGKWRMNWGDDDIDVEVTHWRHLPDAPAALAAAPEREGEA